MKLIMKLLDLIKLEEVPVFVTSVQSKLQEFVQSILSFSVTSSQQDVLKDIENAKAVLKMIKNLTNLMQSLNNVQDDASVPSSEQIRLARMQI